ncbi:hypothetical protein M271_08300 [Streptomyces rapamycinicus NRRL 5491]|nr:hypothetical protein M271_08300 [Streptomyces rapamycinicus NRRL 5491]
MEGHGGQTAASGVTGSRMRFSCKNQIFAGGIIGPGTATAEQRQAASLPRTLP